MDKIIEKVKDKMKERDESATKIVERLFNSHQTFYNFLSGKSITIGNLLKILNEFNLEIFVKDKDK